MRKISFIVLCFGLIVACTSKKNTSIPSVATDFTLDIKGVVETPASILQPEITVIYDSSATDSSKEIREISETIHYTSPNYQSGFHLSVHHQDVHSIRYFVPVSQNPDFALKKEIPFALGIYDNTGKKVSGFRVKGIYVGADTANIFNEEEGQIESLANKKLTVVGYFIHPNGTKMYTYLPPITYTLHN